MFWISDDF